jgi:hypothetical protein
MSESMGGIISECPGDFIGIGKFQYTSLSLRVRRDLAGERAISQYLHF